MNFSRKKDEIYQALIEHQGLQYMIDLAEELLENPVFVYDISGKILAKSSSGESKAVWKELLPDDYLDADKLDIAERTGIIKKMMTVDTPVPGKFSYSPYVVLGCRIRDKDGAVGVVTIVELHPLKEGDSELLVFLCQTILFELLYRERTAMQTIPYFGLLRDIIEGCADEDSVRERCRILRLHIPKSMLLLGIRFSQQRENSLSLYFIRESLMSFLPESLCIIYDMGLLIIINESHMTESLLSLIQKNFSNYEIRIGISRKFSSLSRLREAFQQLLAIQKIRVRLGEDRSHPVIRYDGIGLYHFMELAAQKYGLEEFCSPAVKILEEYDRDNHTFLSESVEKYLEAGRNIQQAAEKMNLHKNTLYYRIQRAEQVAGIDLNDENICFHLQFSYRMKRMQEKHTGEL